MLLFALLLVLAALGLLVVALATSAMFWAWFSVVASVAACVLLIADWWRRKHAPNAAKRRPLNPSWQRKHPLIQTLKLKLDPEAEPAEEDTDAADVLIVTDLDVEVRVLDERPRYHLADCRWVGDRASLPLPVKEARQLGFNPCAVCTPDAVIAKRYRSSAE